MIKVIIDAGVKTPLRKHIHFCKMCLGLNKRSPNVASRNELGRLSLNLQITMNIFKFWIHLENQPPDNIAKLCLNISDKMAQENKWGLINKINLLCTQLNINKQSVNFKNPSTFLSKAENKKNHRLYMIRTNKKLKFYSIFKMKIITRARTRLSPLACLSRVYFSRYPPNGGLAGMLYW